MLSLLTLIAASPARSIIGFFVRLGVFGPFLIEALNSSLLYVPLANELLLVALITSDDTRLMWILYTVSAAAGSAAGAYLLDIVVRRAGDKGVQRMIHPRKLVRLKQKLEQHGARVLFLASAMPPPFPFRVTLIAASSLQTPRRQMLASVFLGRTVRFAAESLLILYLGRRFLIYVNSQAVEYAIYVIAVAAVLGSVYMLVKLFGAR